tara:strand:- start:2537 stop:3163 length:627 start_codon:yes stop_codon:yes gene_type:complete
VAKSPTLNNIEFDAVLEDTFEASVELTGFEIELGARASDHRIIKPFKWSIVGAVSNTPLQAGVTDFAGGLLSNSLDSGVASTVAGLSAGFLAGSSETRSSAALDALLTLMTTGEPFDVDAGDIQLTNMVIGNIRRTKDASNEGGLIFEAELQEYPTLQTTLSNNQPIASQLNQDDPSASQASAVNNRGEIRGLTPSPTTTSLVNGVIS